MRKSISPQCTMPSASVTPSPATTTTPPTATTPNASTTPADGTSSGAEGGNTPVSDLYSSTTSSSSGAVLICRTPFISGIIHGDWPWWSDTTKGYILEVPPSCSTALPCVANSHEPKPNWADSGTTKAKLSKPSP